MIISNSEKFIFVHIPKSGGISVTDAFTKTIRWNDIILHGGKPEYGSELESYYERNFLFHGHQTAAVIRDTIGEATWKDYYSFSFVRNPYARIVSLYTFVSRYVNATDKELWEQQDWYRWPISHAYLTTNSFSEFIRSDYYDQDHATRGQFSWICDENRENIIVDFIGKTESLEEDFYKVLERLQLTELKLEKLNVSNKEDFRNYYSNEADMDYVYNKYQTDFEKFNYSRQLEQT